MMKGKEPKRRRQRKHILQIVKSYETELPLKAFGWAASDTSGTLSPFNFSRRDNGDMMLLSKSFSVVFVILIYTLSRTIGVSLLSLLKLLAR
jgi:hypothetical protein